MLELGDKSVCTFGLFGIDGILIFNRACRECSRGSVSV